MGCMTMNDTNDNDSKKSNTENIPLLVLDNKWHELFCDKKTQKMKTYEKELRKLIALQGKYLTEHKDYLLLKKKIMGDIVKSMAESNEVERQKEMNKNKRYINDINKKLNKIEDKLIGLPSAIDAKNKQLIDESLAIYYNVIVKNKDEIELMERKIEHLREEIKNQIIKKDEMKEETDKLYGYIHDLVGAEVMETYDNKYFAGDHNG
jgi:hypothetical protein